jgi:hypothetical protein
MSFIHAVPSGAIVAILSTVPAAALDTPPVRSTSRIAVKYFITKISC